MNKRCFWTFLVVAVAFLLVPKVEANFACGEVESLRNFSSSWFDVNISYAENPSLTTTCEVSPEGGKYCCDPLSIQGVNWRVGKTLVARIVQNGYFAEPVTLTISGEGFDVFPKMTLRRGVIFRNLTEVSVGKLNVSFNISTFQGYNSLSYILRNVTNGTVREGVLCQNCNEANFVLSEKGQFELEIKARNSEGNEIFERKELWNLDYIEIERETKCPRCNKNFIYSGEVVEVKLVTRFSHEVSGEFRELFPKEWEVIEGGRIEHFSDTHNVAIFDVSGKEEELNYKIKAPKTVFAREFLFEQDFNGYKESESDVLYRFYRFLPFPPKYLRNFPFSNYYFEFQDVSSSSAMVAELNDDNFVMFGVVPRSHYGEAFVFLNKNPPVKKLGSKQSFLIGSSVTHNDIDYSLVRFKVRKQNGREISNLKVYHYDETLDEWHETASFKYSEDSNYGYFETTSEKIGIFSVDYDYRRLNE